MSRSSRSLPQAASQLLGNTLAPRLDGGCPVCGAKMATGPDGKPICSTLLGQPRDFVFTVSAQEASIARSLPGEPLLVASSDIERWPVTYASRVRLLKFSFAPPEMAHAGFAFGIAFSFTEHSRAADHVNIIVKVSAGVVPFGSNWVSDTESLDYSATPPSWPDKTALASTTIDVNFKFTVFTCALSLHLGQMFKLFNNVKVELDLATVKFTYNLGFAGGGFSTTLAYDEATRKFKVGAKLTGTSAVPSGMGVEVNLSESFGIQVPPNLAEALLTPFFREHFGDMPRLPPPTHPTPQPKLPPSR
jgi:hypothetical protein